MNSAQPRLGVGVGFREPLRDLVLTSGLIDWVEVISEHYMADTGKREALRTLRADLPGVPVVPHGVEMSIGSVQDDARWADYVKALAEVVRGFDAPWFSDHLCFTRTATAEIAALTPLPRTREVADRVAERAATAIRVVGRPFLLENIAYHFAWGDEMSDAEFVTAIVEKSGCHLLLDLTNLAYNAANHGFDAADYLRSIPYERVLQVHLAGGTFRDGVYFDTHSAPVPEEVWGLLDVLLGLQPTAAVMLERDQRLEELDEVEADLRRIRTMMDGRA